MQSQGAVTTQSAGAREFFEWSSKHLDMGKQTATHGKISLKTKTKSGALPVKPPALPCPHHSVKVWRVRHEVDPKLELVGTDTDVLCKGLHACKLCHREARNLHLRPDLGVARAHANQLDRMGSKEGGAGGLVVFVGLKDGFLSRRRQGSQTASVSQVSGQGDGRYRR